MFNPLKFRNEWVGFEGRHPKFVMFLKSVFTSGIGEGSVVDIAITLPDGRKIESNMRISAEDVEFFKTLSQMQG